jgi:hypothetical protein
MEEVGVEVLLVVEHAPDRVEEATHDGDEGDFLFLAAGQERLVGGFDLRAALDGDQGGHEESAAQVAVAGAADVAWGIGGAALAGPWVEPGVGDPWLGFQVLGQHEQFAQEAQGADWADARHAAEAFDLGVQVRLARSEFGGGKLQSFDPLLEVAEVHGQVGGDEAVAIGGKGDGVEPSLFAGDFAAELDQAPAELLQGQDSLGGRGPRDELHALEELKDAQRIDAIGLGAGEPGALEVFDCPWIDDHHFHPRGFLQGQSQTQAVDASRFQADASRGPVAGEQLDQLAMPGGRVGQGARDFGLALAQEGHDQLSGADIEAGADLGSCFYGLFHGLVLDLMLGHREPTLYACPRPTLSMQAR